MISASISEEARKLCRHHIVYTDLTDKMVAVRAMQGMTTKAIAREFGLSMSEAQYRIAKAQNLLKTKFRRDYRRGSSDVAKRMLKATTSMCMEVVRDQIAPKLIPYAAPGVPRH